ncbi:MAG: phytochelatin synthase family protein [Cyanobacteriota bacterium]
MGRWRLGSLLAAVALGAAILPAARSATPPPGPVPALIPLADPAGQSLLFQASARADHGPLAQWFETQANLAYCGVASAVVALNSLGVPAPPVPGYGSYRFWTQANAFSIPGSVGYVRPAVVAQEGMTLAQLQGWLAGQPNVVVERFHGDHLSLAQWRELLRRSLADPNDRLLVNYHRPVLGQQGGGHIAPVAASEPRQDLVLIRDVARYRYPSVWVGAETLWRAMRATDASSGRSRGLLLSHRRLPPPPSPASAPAVR